MMPFRSIKRWWRSKGFGIHSPFAFYFILRVLRERLPFYAYHEINALSSPAISHRNLLTLFRIVCYFNPQEVTLPEDTPEAVLKTLRLANSHIRVTRGNSKFQCYFNEDPDSGFFQSASTVMDNECVIVAHRPTPRILQSKETLTNGMTFTNGDRSMFVIVVRHDLPRQDFVINF